MSLSMLPHEEIIPPECIGERNKIEDRIFYERWFRFVEKLEKGDLRFPRTDIRKDVQRPTNVTTRLDDPVTELRRRRERTERPRTFRVL